jgi:hypothetical protein
VIAALLLAAALPFKLDVEVHRVGNYAYWYFDSTGTAKLNNCLIRLSPSLRDELMRTAEESDAAHWADRYLPRYRGPQTFELKMTLGASRYTTLFNEGALEKLPPKLAAFFNVVLKARDELVHSCRR